MVVSQCMIQCETFVCISEQSTGSKPGGEQLAMTGTSLKQGRDFGGLGQSTQQTPAAVQTHHADRQAVNTPAHSLQECSRQVLPVTLLSCALMVSFFWQSGSDHSLTRPLQAPVAKVVPSGENSHAALGRSSAISLLWFVTCDPRHVLALHIPAWHPL